MRETVSQRWRLLQQERQKALERNIAAVRPEIRAHNRELAKAAARLSDEDYHRLAHILVAETDQAWNFHNTPLLVTGKWEKTEITIDTSQDDSVTFSWERPLVPAHEVAISAGFNAVDSPDAPGKQLAYFFAPSLGATSLNFYGLQMGNISLNHEPYAIANPDNVSLQLYGSSESDNVADVKEILNTLDRVDERLAERTRPNAPFYKLSLAKQQVYFSSLTESLYRTVPAVESGQALFVTAQVDKVFLHNIESGYPEAHYSESAEQGRVQGIVRDFTILDSLEEVRMLRREKPLRSRSDCVDAGAGICLTIDTNDEICYVPFRNAASIGLELVNTL